MTTTKRITALMLALACMLVLVAAGLPVSAHAAELGYQPINKVLATLSAEPVAGQSAYDITGATSTEGAVYYGLSWYNSSGTYLDGAFTTDYAVLELRLDAAEGYYFADGLSAYLNNSTVDYTIYNSGQYIILTHTYAPSVWAPTVIKHPGSERVDEGSWCSFVATASGAEKCVWKLKDASGKTYTMEELTSAYSSVTYSDETFGKLILRGIPKELDGSVVYCTFSGAGGSTDTNTAKITVEYEKPSPSPSLSPSPTATPTSSATAAADSTDDGNTATTTDPNHEHSYSREWNYDDEKHWHTCTCGDINREAEHVMTWETTREATKKQAGEERGECGVCDYEVTREVEYVKPASDGRWILYVGIGAIALVIVLMVASSARQKREARRRAAARRRRYERDEY